MGHIKWANLYLEKIYSNSSTHIREFVNMNPSYEIGIKNVGMIRDKPKNASSGIQLFNNHE